MEYISLENDETRSQIDLSLIPEDLVKKHLVLPMGSDNGRLKLVIHDPMDLELLDLLRFRLNRELDTVIAPKSAIKSFIEGTTRTEHENTFGIALNRTLLFVSAGPDGNFGNLDLTDPDFDLIAAADNVYSYKPGSDQ